MILNQTLNKYEENIKILINQKNQKKIFNLIKKSLKVMKKVQSMIKS